MAAPLTAEDRERYTQIVDAILATADLETVTRKKVRTGLEAALGGKDLSAQKIAIKDLIEQRFDAISTREEAKETTGVLPLPPSNPDITPSHDSPSVTPARLHQSNGSGATKREIEADEIKVSISQPIKKKQRRESTGDTQDADAKLAALLQAQENARTARTTRGGGATKNATKKARGKTPRKKSDKKIRTDDDSDVDGSAVDDSGSGTGKKAGGGFQKPFQLSYALADLCEIDTLSRPQVVKKLWEHIKANDLQDPKDKRQIRCDEKMQAIFKQARVDMFQMNKLLGSHLYPIDEE